MTPQEAAQWMVEELHRNALLIQEETVYSLYQRNEALTYQNDNGNLAISKLVLKEFNRLTEGDSVVWSRSERLWRFRADYDAPGRMQD